MQGRGSALRFLAVMTGGWVMARIVMLWPQPYYPQEPARTAAIAPRPIAGVVRVTMPALPLVPRITVANAFVEPETAPVSAKPASDPQRVALALLAMMRFGSPEPVARPASLIVAGPPADRLTADTWTQHGITPERSPTRWSGSAWLVARDGRGVGASLSGSQLGGSQAGVRLAYALGSARRVAIVGRIASPLAGAGQEGAIGVEWRPTRLPIRLVAEQRIGINGAAGGPSLALVGGVDRVPIGRGFRLESYGQAGVIGRGGLTGYADGAVRVNRQVAMIGESPIDLGGGGWGAIQPDVARLDLGPSLGARLPIGANSVRLSLDWRQRVAGNAQPGSGPALSIGTDF